MTTLFPPLPDGTRRLLNDLPVLIDRVFPLPGRFRAGLGQDVAELSRLLTSERGERGALYLGKPSLLSAYLRYFLPWNVYRLSRLFTALPLNLKAHDAVNDLGSGPLTLALSLWISRPDLRDLPLEFRCVDRSPAVMDAGKKIFAALSREGAAASPRSPEYGGGQNPLPWTIKTIRGEIRRNGTLSAEIRGKPAALSAALNVYNELFWDLPPRDTEGLERFAEKQTRLLASLTERGSGSLLVVEPGIPRSGEFISLLRAACIEEGFLPLSPCTHRKRCPLDGKPNDSGGKTKWCHFAFDTGDSPEKLRALSAAAKLPKERAVLSFILAGAEPGETRLNTAPEKGTRHSSSAPEPAVKVRVISDSFPVGNYGAGGFWWKEPAGNDPLVGNSAQPPEKDRTRTGRRNPTPADSARPAGNSWGRYGCAEPGLVLVSGSRGSLESSPSGALLELRLENALKDAKSGALKLSYRKGESTTPPQAADKQNRF